MTVPNLLTVLRLALAPVVIWGILEGRHALVLVVFAAAAVTDALDGALARRFHWSSRAGAFLDKILLSGVYVALALAGTLPWWFVGLVLGRDVLILAGSGMALLFTRMREFRPSLWGKLNTILQSATAAAWMARNAYPHPALDAAARALIWPTVLATVWSGLDYGWRGFRSAKAGQGTD